MWQFVRGVEGIRDEELALETTVVGSTVGFSNDTQERGRKVSGQRS